MIFSCKPCTFKLPFCGHSCSLPCHSPAQQEHMSQCERVMERPCPEHSTVPLICYKLQLQSPMSSNLQEAFDSFEYEVEVDYRRPECPHSVRTRCGARKVFWPGMLCCHLAWR